MLENKTNVCSIRVKWDEIDNSRGNMFEKPNKVSGSFWRRIRFGHQRMHIVFISIIETVESWTNCISVRFLFVLETGKKKITKKQTLIKVKDQCSLVPFLRLTINKSPDECWKLRQMKHIIHAFSQSERIWNNFLRLGFFQRFLVFYVLLLSVFGGFTVNKSFLLLAFTLYSADWQYCDCLYSW